MADAKKLLAQDRILLSLGGNIFQVEMLRDMVEELTAKLAERDATIAKLISSMKPEAGETN